MEMLNEVFVLVYTYHLYLFTDFMPNLEVRLTVGTILIYFAMFNIALNLGASMLGSATSAIWRCKLFYLQYKRYRRVKKEKKEKKKKKKR